MKKASILVALILVTTVVASAKDFTVTLYSDYLTVADSSYTDTYGGKKVFPEVKFTYRYKGNFYLWGSFGYLPANLKWDKWSNKGEVEADLKMKDASQKIFFSTGLGYWIGYIDRGQVAIRGEMGLCGTYNYTKITQKTISTQNVIVTERDKQWGIGVRGTFGVNYGLTKKLFTEANVGYMYVWAKNDEGDWVNAGGFRLAMGMGLKF
ncbi:MAG: hypothetical protein QG657_621 [Acidobacteriota bacterium]|nr:hypothetical protein [Acidobacteriota bacterium]